MLGRVVQNNAMRRIRQEGRSRRHRLQDPVFALHAQIDLEFVVLSDQPHQRFRGVCRQAIHNEMPLPRWNTASLDSNSRLERDG